MNYRMFKRRLRLLSLIAFGFCFMTADAYDFVVDGLYYNILYTRDGQPTTEVEVTNRTSTSDYPNGDNSYSGDIVIPASVTYNGVTYTVVQIKRSAFAGCDNLNSVMCPSTMHSIGMYAFWQSPLKKITLNEGLVRIMDDAFNDTELSELYIPKTVTELPNKMDNFVPSTTKITIHPDNPNYVIPDGALYTRDMKQLLRLPSVNEAEAYGQIFVVPEGVETVRTYGNYYTYGDLVGNGFKTVVLPKTIKEMWYWVYGNLVIQSSVPPSPISPASFRINNGCRVFIPVGSLGNYKESKYWESYAKDGTLTEMVLDKEHTISLKTTLNCEAQVTVNGNSENTVKVAPWTPVRVDITLPEKSWDRNRYVSWLYVNGESLADKIVDEFAEFLNGYGMSLEKWEKTGLWTQKYEFYSLDDVVIDIAMGVESFADPNLPLNYTPNSPTSVTVSLDGVPNGESDKYEILHIPETVEHEGKSWNVTEIKEGRYRTFDLKEVYIPGSVTKIGGWALSFSSLEKVHFSEGLQYIGGDAFKHAKLTDVELPQSLIKCDGGAFGSLRRINIPSNMEKMEYISYKYVENLIIDDSSKPLYGQILNKDSVKCLYVGRDIGLDSQFRESKSLEEVTVGPMVFTLPDNMFVKNKNLKKVNIFGTDLTIGGAAFFGCESLEEVNIPQEAHVALIGTGAFQNCKSLKTVTFLDRVDNIGHYALAGCENLSEITIPETIREIKNSFFYDCKNLRTLNIQDGKEPLKIADTAFDECPLENLYYGRQIEESHPTFFGTKTLKRVDIGEYVDKLPSYTFGDCDNLKDIYCHNSQPPTLGKDVFRGVNKEGCDLHLPSGGDDSYKNADTWKDFFTSDAISSNTIMENEISSVSGNIVIKGCSGEMVEISSVDGTVIYSQRIDNDMVSIPLPAGLYIVKVKDVVKKVINK